VCALDLSKDAGCRLTTSSHYTCPSSDKTVPIPGKLTLESSHQLRAGWFR
jgi:hypothetical protein